MREIYKIEGLSDEQRQYLFAAFDVGKTIVGYSQREVDQALKKLGVEQ